MKTASQITMSALLALLATAILSFSAAAQEGVLTLNATMTKGGAPITKGLVWRIFDARTDSQGKLPLEAKEEGGAARIRLKQGEYLVHLAYGYATAIQRVMLDSTDKTETIVLNAGALQLNAVAAGDIPIQPRFVHFSVFSVENDPNTGRRKQIASGIKPGQIVPFPAGTYHVVSKYGKLNAETRADLQVQAGKVTEATLQQRAALITFRLVSQKGGDAIADTAWSILTEDGTVISETASTIPSMVLSEGNYTAVAKNNVTTYSQNFEVKSGGNMDVEVLAEDR